MIGQFTQNLDYEKLELFFYCEKLKNMDATGLSDPKIELHYSTDQHKWTKVGETEVVKESLNPKFHTSINVDFIFEIHQYFKIKVIDVDSSSKSDDLLGEVFFELGDIVGGRKNPLKLPLQDNKGNKKGSGDIYVRYERPTNNNMNYTFGFIGHSIKNIKFFSKSSPFLRIFRLTDLSQPTTELHKIKDKLW